MDTQVSRWIFRYPGGYLGIQVDIQVSRWILRYSGGYYSRVLKSSILILNLASRADLVDRCFNKTYSNKVNNF